MEQFIRPLSEDVKHTYSQICVKVRHFYGVEDAERWFMLERRKVTAALKKDYLGIGPFSTLKAFWENRQMVSKWEEPLHEQASDVKHTVQIYSVRAPGAGGELGVLTTAHEVDEFVSGLAAACAKYISEQPVNKPQLERDLAWIFRNAFPLAFKLAGYKADQVVERHVLMCGSNAPSADDIIASA